MMGLRVCNLVELTSQIIGFLEQLLCWYALFLISLFYYCLALLVCEVINIHELKLKCQRSGYFISNLT